MRLKPPGAAEPTVSAILLSYNCERYIEAALESALEQDYEGVLEIVVSDDASTDRTFDIVRDRAVRYGGPHRIVLRRRAKNSGSKSAHLNDALPTCTGDILVSFDGDDVAERSRVSAIVASFRADHRAQAVYSAFSLIDELGRARGKARVRHPPAGTDPARWFARVDAYAPGATLAIHRFVVDTFGTLDPGINEDVVLPFRASLLGCVKFIAEPQVKVRRHAASLTAEWQQFASIERYRERMLSGIERAEQAMRGRLADLAAAATLMPEQQARWQELRALVEQSLQEAQVTRSLTSSSLGVRVRALMRLLHMRAYLDELPQHICLALIPGLYLRYKRRRLGIRPVGSRAAERGALSR